MKIVYATTKPQIADSISTVVSPKDEIVFAYTEAELKKTLNNTSDLDHLFVHEDFFGSQYPWDWAHGLRTSTSAKTKITVLMSDGSDSIYREILYRLSLDFQLSLVPGALTVEELSDEIKRILYPSKSSNHSEDGRVISFMSAAPKDGSTTLAISTAFCLAQRVPDKKVILIDLNLKSPEIRDHLHITSDKGYPLIQADCDSGTLEAPSLMKACHNVREVPNLYVLTGIQRREWAEKISLEEVTHLIRVAKQEFDVILIDVHSYPDQAATLKVVKNADERIVVVQPLITSYQSSWNDWFNSVWQHYGLAESDFHLVLNRGSKKLLESLQIQKSMGSKVVSHISNAEKGAGVRAVNFGKPIYMDPENDQLEFKQDVLQFTAWLARRANIELSPLPADHKGALKGKTRGMGVLGFLRSGGK
ncbi:CpaE family protein [Paenibacillus sp. D51F]